MTVHEDETVRASAESERRGSCDDTECGKQYTKEIVVKSKDSVDGSEVSATESNCATMKFELNIDQKSPQTEGCTEVSRDKYTLGTSCDFEEEAISSKCVKSTCRESLDADKVSAVEADCSESYSQEEPEGKIKMLGRESADKSTAILKVEADDTKNVDDITKAMAKTSLCEGEDKLSAGGEKDLRAETEEDDSSCEFLGRAPTGGQATVYPTSRDKAHFDFDWGTPTIGDTVVVCISQKRSMDEDNQPLSYRKLDHPQPTENDEMQYQTNAQSSPTLFSTCELASMTGGTVSLANLVADNRAKLNDILLEDNTSDLSFDHAWSPSSGLGSSVDNAWSPSSGMGSLADCEVPSDGYSQIPSPDSFISSGTNEEEQDWYTGYSSYLQLSPSNETEDTLEALKEFEKVLKKIASQETNHDISVPTNAENQQKMASNEGIQRCATTFRPIIPKPTTEYKTGSNKPDQQPVTSSMMSQGGIRSVRGPERTKEVEEEERRALTWVSSLTFSQLVQLDQDEDSLIHLAVLQQEPYILKALLARLERESIDLKQFINKRDREDMTALYMAIIVDPEEGKASVQEEIIEELLKHGADVDIPSRRSRQAGVVYDSPLHVAAERGKPRILNQLLRYTCNIDKKNNILETPVHCAINARSRSRDNNTEHFEVLKVLKEHNANFAVKTTMNKTVLHLAAEKGDHQLMEYLLYLLPPEVIASIINEQDDNENTALHLATGFELQPTAERVLAAKFIITHLLKREANVKLRNRQNKTALNFVPKSLMDEIGGLFKRKANVSASYQ